MTMRFLTGAALCLVARASYAQDAPPRACPHDTTLAAITARGRALAGHDRAAWDASDALIAAKPDTAGLATYVVLREGDGWRVAFGRLAPSRDTFHVGYEVRRTGPDSVHGGWVAVRVRPARAETGAAPRVAAAQLTARAAFDTVTHPQRPYVFSVIPADGGEWWAYATPAVLRWGAWPLGADVRWRISADGARVLATRRMHNAILEFADRPDEEGNRPESGFSTAVLDVLPEDSDVFHVLQRTPRVRQLVASDAWVFEIATDGGIRCLGDRRAVLGGER